MFVLDYVKQRVSFCLIGKKSSRIITHFIVFTLVRKEGIYSIKCELFIHIAHYFLGKNTWEKTNSNWKVSSKKNFFYIHNINIQSLQIPICIELYISNCQCHCAASTLSVYLVSIAADTSIFCKSLIHINC